LVNGTGQDVAMGQRTEMAGARETVKANLQL
jgi:hypothetical protein